MVDEVFSKDLEYRAELIVSGVMKIIGVSFANDPLRTRAVSYALRGLRSGYASANESETSCGEGELPGIKMRAGALVNHFLDRVEFADCTYHSGLYGSLCNAIEKALQEAYDQGRRDVSVESQE